MKDDARGPSWKQVKDIVADAFELPEDERDEFVRAACGDDESLLHEVRELLSPSERTVEVFDRGPAFATKGPEMVDVLGRTLGPYRITQKIAEGGMGAVYAAEQEHPQRTVAVKVLREGFSGESVRQRFHHEIDVLGRLQHPAVAQIYGAGADDETGSPFFAMELIAGDSITDFARERGLDHRARIELLARVCEGVHYAHQRGVIHRDLKPENVLIDQSGDPKILDFGIARVTSGDSRVDSQRTQIGQIMGTFAYMSPEQVSGDPDRIDIRVDVYALGVILYEMLTGTLPIEVDRLSMPEAIQRIESHRPVLPSRHDRELRGDIDTVVMAALAKDRTDRYASASEFGADLMRIVRFETISIRPPTTLYVLTRFARRNRALVSLSILAVVLLIAAVIGTAIGMFRAEEQLIRANRERDNAIDNAENARRINHYLHLLIAGVQPEVLGGAETITAVLEEWAKSIPGSLPNNPELEAEMSEVVGWTYHNLRLHAQGEPHLRRAAEGFERHVGPLDKRTLNARVRLVQVRTSMEKSDLASSESFSATTLTRCEKALGADDVVTMDAMMAHAMLLWSKGENARAESLFVEILERNLRAIGPLDLRTLTTRNNFGRLLQDSNKHTRAEEQLRTAYDIFAKHHPNRYVGARLRCAEALTELMTRRGAHRDATPILRDIVAHGKGLWGATHRRTLRKRNQLIHALFECDANEDAVKESRALVAELTRTLGRNDPQTLTAEGDLGTALGNLEEVDSAITLLADVLERRTRVNGPDDFETLVVRNNYAHNLQHRDAPGAVKEFREVVSRALANEYPQGVVAKFRLNLGRCLLRVQDWDAAERELLAARKVFLEDPLATQSLAKTNAALADLEKRRNDKK